MPDLSPKDEFGNKIERQRVSYVELEKVSKKKVQLAL